MSAAAQYSFQCEAWRQVKQRSSGSPVTVRHSPCSSPLLSRYLSTPGMPPTCDSMSRKGQSWGRRCSRSKGGSPVAYGMAVAFTSKARLPH